jgi:hypothetical protein
MQVPALRAAVTCKVQRGGGGAAPTGRNRTVPWLARASFLVVQEPDAAAAVWMDRETRVVKYQTSIQGQ